MLTTAFEGMGLDETAVTSTGLQVCDDGTFHSYCISGIIHRLVLFI
jgi:hypothetical protein